MDIQFYVYNQQLNKTTDLVTLNCIFKMQKIKKGQFMSQDSSNESFQLQPHQMKKFGFAKNKNKQTAGSWSPEENRIYLQFLMNYQNDFKTQEMRRKNKVFYRISKLLKRRTPDQCRSHHQKLLIKNKGDYQKLIKQLLSKIQTSQKGIGQILERKKMLKTEQIQFEKSESQKNDERRTMLIEQNPFKINEKHDRLEIVLNIKNVRVWCQY